MNKNINRANILHWVDFILNLKLDIIFYSLFQKKPAKW